MSVINDDELKSEMIDDIVERCNCTKNEARVWVEEHGSSIVDDMWTAYSRYIEDNGPEIQEDEEDYE